MCDTSRAEGRESNNTTKQKALFLKKKNDPTPAVVIKEKHKSEEILKIDCCLLSHYFKSREEHIHSTL